MSSTQLVQRKGIYHGLPVYSDGIRGLTAVVTGANGISGYHMLRVLAEAPERWTKIYCLSRRPPAIPGGLPKNAEFISCDFLKGPGEIAATLKDKGFHADYIFFYSYIQAPSKPDERLWSDVDEMTRLNSALLGNFLGALEKLEVRPKRFMLQTGAKNYGVHLGPVKTPCLEDDPRVTLESNFYYAQEDLLWAHCGKQSVGWNIAMPGAILGAVPDAAMNFCLPLAIYAAVSKHLKQPLVWPFCMRAWQSTTRQSSATLNAYMEEWAVLTDNVKNEKFNIVDDSSYSPERLWPKLAAWYGIEWTAPAVYGHDDGVTEIFYGFDPPPRGYGPRAKLTYLFLLSDWAARPEVEEAWRQIAEDHGLVNTKLSDHGALFKFADGMFGAEPCTLSMNKARKNGWHGFVDSAECIREVFEEFVKLRMIPPLPTSALYQHFKLGFTNDSKG